MKIKQPIILLMLLLNLSCDVPKENLEEPETERINLNDWLNIVCDRKEESDKLRKEHKVDTSAFSLIHQYSLIDTSFNIKDSNSISRRENFRHPYLQGIKCDLDNDSLDEVICFIGKVYSTPSILIFELNRQKEYTKIFEKQLFLHNEYPKFKLIKNENESTKLVRTGEFHHRGSGHWLYVYKYFKKINNGIEQVLETPYSAMDGMHFDLFTSSANLITDTLTNENQLQLKYDYSTKGSYYFDKELKKTHDPINLTHLIQDNNMVISLNWNNAENKYNGSELSKINALMNIENDTIQWNEFGDKIKQEVDYKTRKIIKKRLN